MPNFKTIQTKKDLDESDFEYNYNTDLTFVLDDIRTEFDQNVINAITLWKVNRYAYLDKHILKRLNTISNDLEIKEEHKNLLSLLLGCKGVQLPMASTFLRFRNPMLFQIIDQRVYRLLTGCELVIPIGNTTNARERSCNLYFEYLERLRNKCRKLEIPFEKADRILYNADKRLNKDKKLKNYGG